MQKVPARHLFRLTDVIGERHLIAKSSVVSGETCVVLLTSLESPDYRTPDNMFVRSRSKKPNHFRVHVWKDHEISTIDIEPTLHNIHFAEVMHGGKMLLVCGRSRQGYENGFLYDESGHQTSSVYLGDGIENVQATPDGKTIWVGYFDEGVFGDSELGQQGLVAFHPDGTPGYQFGAALRNDNPLEIPDICDCYAMNVPDDKNVFLYYYTDFPLVQITDGVFKKIWPDLRSRRGREPQGSHTFAVSNERALFSGGYNVDDRLHLYHLNPGIPPEQSVIPVDTNGTRIKISKASFARGKRFFIVQDDDVFVIELDYDL